MADTALRAAREKLVREHMEDENRLAFEKVLATFPHPHYEIIPTGDVFDDEQVNGYYKDTRAAFPDQRNELTSLRHADDAVMVEFWLRGTHLGDYRGLSATGNKFEVKMTALFIFEGEKLVCERVYFDSLTMVRQLLGKADWKSPKSVLKLARTLAGMLKALKPRK